MLNKPDEADISDDVTEARVRRSLGLSSTPPSHGGHSGHGGSSSPASGNGNGGGTMQRRRFVRDGEVPVVIVHPKSEADSRHAAAIADLTRQRDAERTVRLRAEQALHEAQATIQSLQTRIAHAEMARTEAATAVTPPPAVLETAPDVPSPDQPRRRPEKSPEPEEPIPVKWWR